MRSFLSISLQSTLTHFLYYTLVIGGRPGLDVEVCHMTAARSTYSCHEAAVVLDCLQLAKLGGSLK